MSFVAILMGSDSDWPVMQATVDVLKSLEVECEVRVSSAHRTPAETAAYVNDASGRGCEVFICAAGMAALRLAPARAHRRAEQRAHAGRADGARQTRTGA